MSGGGEGRQARSWGARPGGKAGLSPAGGQQWNQQLRVLSYSLVSSQQVHRDELDRRRRQGVSLCVRLRVGGARDQAQTELRCSCNVGVRASVWKQLPKEGEGPLCWGFLACPRTPTRISQLALGADSKPPCKGRESAQRPANRGIALCAKFESCILNIQEMGH